jgi:hypothetical protein
LRKPGFQKDRDAAGDELQVIARDRAETFRRDIEGNDRGLARIGGAGGSQPFMPLVTISSGAMPSGRFSEAEHMPDRKGFDGGVQRQFAVIDDLDAADAGEGARRRD